MKQLTISKNDIYKIGDDECFKFQYHNSIYRNNFVNLKKNTAHQLHRIAEFCELKHKGINKQNLIKLIEDSNCLLFDEN